MVEERGGDRELEEVVREAIRTEGVLRGAVREALLVHKKLGHPIVAMEGDRIVWIAPEDIPVDEVPGDGEAGARARDPGDVIGGGGFPGGERGPR